MENKMLSIWRVGSLPKGKHSRHSSVSTQLFGYEPAERANDRHLFGIDFVERQLPAEVLAKGADEIQKAQGVNDAGK
jgi:hypothetical protein